MISSLDSQTIDFLFASSHNSHSNIYQDDVCMKKRRVFVYNVKIMMMGKRAAVELEKVFIETLGKSCENLLVIEPIATQLRN